MQSVEEMLISPETKQAVIVSAEGAFAGTSRSDISYPIRQGIIDFLPTVQDPISVAYDRLAARYDSYMMSPKLYWKAIRKVCWGFTRAEEYTEKVLSAIPEGFEGVILDVPVGTAVLSVEKYTRLKRARIIGLDYSFGMLRSARTRVANAGINNMTFIRGDVRRLPIRDSSIDVCLSMNGLHAFPEKERALAEIHRALKPGGAFVGCFYVTGKRGLTDLFVWSALSRGGSFTRPFHDEKDGLALLERWFEVTSHGNRKSILYFESRKKQN